MRRHRLRPTPPTTLGAKKRYDTQSLHDSTCFSGFLCLSRFLPFDELLPLYVCTLVLLFGLLFLHFCSYSFDFTFHEDSMAPSTVLCGGLFAVERHPECNTLDTNKTRFGGSGLYPFVGIYMYLPFHFTFVLFHLTF